MFTQVHSHQQACGRGWCPTVIRRERSNRLFCATPTSHAGSACVCSLRCKLVAVLALGVIVSRGFQNVQQTGALPVDVRSKPPSGSPANSAALCESSVADWRIKLWNKIMGCHPSGLWQCLWAPLQHVCAPVYPFECGLYMCLSSDQPLTSQPPSCSLEPLPENLLGAEELAESWDWCASVMHYACLLACKQQHVKFRRLRQHAASLVVAARPPRLSGAC